MRSRSAGVLPPAVLAGAIFLILGVAGIPAFAEQGAQPGEAAESLFREGKALMRESRFEEACAKFSASHNLEPGLGTLLNLADCHEQLGATASAWAEFIRAESLARRIGQKAREDVARDRAEALEPRLVRLKIVVPEATAVEGLEIQRGAVGLPQADWGSAIPVDPGSYAVFARAPGKRTFETEVQLQNAGETVELVIEPLADMLPVAEPVEQPLFDSSAPVQPPPRAALIVRPASAMRTLGLAVGGAGLAGLASAGIFGVLAENKWDQAGCRSGVCPTQASQTKAEDARRLASFGTVALVAGGVLTGVGATIYFLVLHDSEPPPASASVRWLPSIAANGGGVTAVGRF